MTKGICHKTITTLSILPDFCRVWGKNNLNYKCVFSLQHFMVRVAEFFAIEGEKEGLIKANTNSLLYTQRDFMVTQLLQFAGRIFPFLGSIKNPLAACIADLLFSLQVKIKPKALALALNSEHSSSAHPYPCLSAEI